MASLKIVNFAALNPKFKIYISFKIYRISYWVSTNKLGKTIFCFLFLVWVEPRWWANIIHPRATS